MAERADSTCRKIKRETSAVAEAVVAAALAEEVVSAVEEAALIEAAEAVSVIVVAEVAVVVVVALEVAVALTARLLIKIKETLLLSRAKRPLSEMVNCPDVRYLLLD